MRRARHAVLFLMVIGKYAYGDHVVDPEAFIQRARSYVRRMR